MGMVRVCASFCFPRLGGRRGSVWPDDWLVFKQPGRAARRRGSPLWVVGSGIAGSDGGSLCSCSVGCPNDQGTKKPRTEVFQWRTARILIKFPYLSIGQVIR